MKRKITAQDIYYINSTLLLTISTNMNIKNDVLLCD